MATEDKKPAAARKSTSRSTKTAAPAPDLGPITARLDALEAAQKATGQQLEALQRRIDSMGSGGGGGSASRVQIPEGFMATIRHAVERLTELVRQNPITALILIVAFLLVALFT